MKKAFFFLMLIALVVSSDAQPARRPKAIILKPIGIVELNDKDLTIKEIAPDSPAQRGGLQVGDRIERVNRKRFRSREELLKYLNALEETKDIVFRVKRGRKTKNITLLPKEEKPLLGFSCAPKKYYTLEKRAKQTHAYLKGKKCAVSISTPTIRPGGLLYATLEIENLSDEKTRFEPREARALADDAPLKWLTPEGAATRIKKEQIDKEMSRHPIRRHKKFRAKIKTGEEFRSRLIREAIESVDIQPYETARGLILFDNPFRITEIKFIVKVGDETFGVKFEEFLRYSLKE